MVVEQNAPGSQIDLSARHVDGVFRVKTEAVVETSNELQELMAYHAGAYAGIVNAGHAGTQMQVRLYSVSGVHAANFGAHATWARAFAAEEMSNVDYVTRVLGTFESVD
jgi:hypothetical protein